MNAIATDTTTSRRGRRRDALPETIAVEGGIENPPAEKQKRPRKPRAPGGSGFVGELRASAAKHRASLSKLVEAEKKLELQLATVRAEREAAEGPLAEVEAILARMPELPSVDEPATVAGVPNVDPTTGEAVHS